MILSMVLIDSKKIRDPFNLFERHRSKHLKEESKAGTTQFKPNALNNNARINREPMKIVRKRIAESFPISHTVKVKVGGNSLRLVLDFENSYSWIGSSRSGLRRGPDMKCSVIGFDRKNAICSGVMKETFKSGEYEWADLIFLNRDHSVEQIDGVIGASVDSKFNNFIFDARLGRIYMKPTQREIDASCLIYQTETLTSDRYWQVTGTVAIGHSQPLEKLDVRFTSLPHPIRLPRNLWNEFMRQLHETGIDAHTSRVEGGITANKCEILKLPYIIILLQGRQLKINPLSYARATDSATCHVNVEQTREAYVVLSPDAIDGKKLYFNGMTRQIQICRDSFE